MCKIVLLSFLRRQVHELMIERKEECPFLNGQTKNTIIDQSIRTCRTHKMKIYTISKINNKTGSIQEGSQDKRICA